MSTQVNSDKIENIAVQQGSGSSKAPAAASVGVSTTALLSALQSPSGSIGDDYSLISFMFSEDEAEEVQKLAAKQAFNLEQLSSDPKVKEDASDAAGATKGTGTSGKNAIAESSKLMSQLQNKAQNQLVEQLENEKKLLENELQAAQKQEELWQKFMKDWTAYQNNPDYDNFAALMDDITDIYGKNSAEGKEAQNDEIQAKEAWHNQCHKDSLPWYDPAKWFEPDYWNDFKGKMQGMLDTLMAFATLNPAEFSIIMQSMDQMAKNQVKNLMTQIEFMNVLIMIVAGGGNPVAQMQALMNVMMQMGMQNNEQSTQRTQILNNFTIANDERQAREIEKQIDKIHQSEHHHGGILGFFEDLVDSIVKFFENPIGTIVDAVKNIGEMFKKVITDIKDGHLFKALEDLTVALVVTALVFEGGPLAAIMMGTQVGKDLENCVKLVVDTIGAIMETVYDLLDAAATDSKDPLDKIGGVWEKVAQNPELELVLQVVAVAVIIASALSGQLYLAAFMTVLLALSMSGALTDLTNAIAKSLGDSATDKLIASILVTVIVSVCSLGVGAAGAFAEVAAEEAAQVATEVGEQVAQSAEQSGKSFAKKLSESIFSKRAAYAGLTGLGTGITSTNMGFDIADLTLSKKDKKKYELWLALAIDLLGAALAAGGGMGMASKGFAAMDSAISSGITKVASKVSDSLAQGLEKFFANSAPQLASAASTIQRLSALIGGVAQMEEGALQIEVGKMYKKLQELFAEMTMINTTSDDLTQQEQHLSQSYKSLTKEQGDINKNCFNAIGGGVEGTIRSLLGEA
jgi:hypothetical protein